MIPVLWLVSQWFEWTLDAHNTIYISSFARYVIKYCPNLKQSVLNILVLLIQFYHLETHSSYKHVSLVGTISTDVGGKNNNNNIILHLLKKKKREKKRKHCIPVFT